MIKITSLLLCHSLCWPLLLLSVAGGESISNSEKPEIEFKVEKTSTVQLDAQRKMRFEIVAPPELPPAPVAAKKSDPSPEALARRAYLRANGPIESRLLSLTAIVYDDGTSLLRWGYLTPEKTWKSFEAWSTVDFSSLWLVGDFEVNRVRYLICPSVLPASKRFAGALPHPGPFIPDAATPGFKLTKGDSSDEKGLLPLRALHEVYRQEGSQLTSLWLTRENENRQIEEWKKANPPVPQDTVIRIWPKKSRRHNSTRTEGAAK